MCDYSLYQFHNRLANTGENLVIHKFSNGCTGLIVEGSHTAENLACAICIPPGSKLKFSNIPDGIQKHYKVGPEEEVVFTQISMKVNSLARILTISLGALWLLDGILQLQPAMFTAAFVQQVLVPNLQGQPSAIAALINFGISIWSLNPFWFNVLAAGIQLLIGALLIIPWFVCDKKSGATNHNTLIIKFALRLSIAWALIIWIFGEGFGAIATGTATFYTGAPGSALLYAILALFLLDEMNERRDKTDKHPLAKLPIAAGIIFLVGAALQLAPMFWQPTALAILGNLAAVGALAVLGILLIRTPRSRTVAWLACAFLITVWWIGQNFGGIFSFPSGTATDPNSAVVLVLFLVPGILF